jgi:Lysyl oxidase
VGVNLVTRVRNFSIETRTFSPSDHDVQDGCVTPGTHKLLRFDFLSHNAGDADLVIGSPAARPDLFVWSAGHGHYHLKDFNEFLFFAASGNLATVGYKQAFCAIDIERIAPNASATGRFHDCNSDQGISAGWADVYSAFLPCQYVVIDGLPNGDYTLQSTTNAQHRVGEDCYGDNTIWTGLRITGNSVQVIDPPYIPEDRIPFNRANLAVIQAGGRWKVAEGNHWMLDTGTSQAEAQRALDIINHYKLASMCFVGRPRCGDISPMMYWLNDNGRAPTGQLAGEDCIPFDPTNLAVVEIGGRWKVVEGTHWLLDFGPGQGNAIAALHFIRTYRFNQICFVGRPDPSMTYFKTSRGRPGHVHVLDLRRIEATIDPPVWWHQQVDLVGRQAPALDLSQLCIGTGPSRREEGGFVLTVQDAEVSEALERHGIVGLATAHALQIELPQPAGVVDVGVAHFGAPPIVVGYWQDKEVARAGADERQRQIENLRLVADRIDRVVIVSEDGEAVLNYIRTQPATGKRPRRRSSSG